MTTRTAGSSGMQANRAGTSDLPPAHTKCNGPQSGCASVVGYETFQSLVEAANRGEPGALAQLQGVLRANPDICKQVGDLAGVAERAWLNSVAGQNALGIEAVKQQLAELKAELRGEQPTPLESLLVDQIAMTWLAAQSGEMDAAQGGDKWLAQAAFRQRRAESCQRRFLNAVKMLATLRALAPRGLEPRSRLKVIREPGAQSA